MSGAAVDLVAQLMPVLLRLQRDTVANVRITLARCLARHTHCLLGIISCSQLLTVVQSWLLFSNFTVKNVKRKVLPEP